MPRGAPPRAARARAARVGWFAWPAALRAMGAMAALSALLCLVVALLFALRHVLQRALGAAAAAAIRRKLGGGEACASVAKASATSWRLEGVQLRPVGAGTVGEVRLRELAYAGTWGSVLYAVLMRTEVKLPFVARGVEVRLSGGGGKGGQGERQQQHEEEEEEEEEQQHLGENKRHVHQQSPRGAPPPQLASTAGRVGAKGMRVVAESAGNALVHTLTRLVELRVADAAVLQSEGAPLLAVEGATLRCASLSDSAVELEVSIARLLTKGAAAAELRRFEARAKVRLGGSASLEALDVTCEDVAVLATLSVGARAGSDEQSKGGNTALDDADAAAQALDAAIAALPSRVSVNVDKLSVCALIEDDSGARLRPLVGVCHAICACLAVEDGTDRVKCSVKAKSTRVGIRSTSAPLPSTPANIDAGEKPASILWSSSTLLAVEAPLPRAQQSFVLGRDRAASVQLQLDYTSATHGPCLAEWIEGAARASGGNTKHSGATASQASSPLKMHAAMLDWTVSVEGQGWQLQLSDFEQLGGENASIQLATTHVTAMLPSQRCEVPDDPEFTLLLGGLDVRQGDCSAAPLLQAASLVCSLEGSLETASRPGALEVKLELEGGRAYAHTDQLARLAKLARSDGGGMSRRDAATARGSGGLPKLGNVSLAVRLCHFELQLATTAPTMPTLATRDRASPVAGHDFTTSLVLGELEVCGELDECAAPRHLDVIVANTWLRSYQGASDEADSRPMLCAESATAAVRWLDEASPALARPSGRVRVAVSDVDFALSVERCVAAQCVMLALEDAARGARSSRAGSPSSASPIDGQPSWAVSLQLNEVAAAIALSGGGQLVVRTAVVERAEASAATSYRGVTWTVDGRRMLTADKLLVMPPSSLHNEGDSARLRCPDLAAESFRQPSSSTLSILAQNALAPPAGWLVEAQSVTILAPLQIGLRATYDAVDDTVEMLTGACDAVKEAFSETSGADSASPSRASEPKHVLQLNVGRFTVAVEDAAFERWLSVRMAAMATALPERVARETLFEAAAWEADVGDGELAAPRARLERTHFASFRRAWEKAAAAAAAIDTAADLDDGFPRPPHGMAAAACTDMCLRLAQLASADAAVEVARAVDVEALEVPIDRQRAKGFAFCVTSAAATLAVRQHSAPLARIAAGRTYGVIAAVAEQRCARLEDECRAAAARSEDGRARLGPTLDMIVPAAESHRPPLKFYANVGVAVQDGVGVFGPGYEGDMSDVIHALSFHFSKAAEPTDIQQPDTCTETKPSPSGVAALKTAGVPLTIDVPALGSAPPLALSSPPVSSSTPWWDDLRMLAHGRVDVRVDDAVLTILGGCGMLGEGPRSQRLVSRAAVAEVCIELPTLMTLRSEDLCISHSCEEGPMELATAPIAELRVEIAWQCGFGHDPSKHFLHAAEWSAAPGAPSPERTPPLQRSASANLERRRRAFRATGAELGTALLLHNRQGEKCASSGTRIALSPEAIMRFKAIVLAVVRPVISVQQISPFRQSSTAGKGASRGEAGTSGQALDSGGRVHRGRSLGSLLTESKMLLDIEPLVTTYQVSGLISPEHQAQLHALRGRASSLSVAMHFRAPPGGAMVFDDLAVDLGSVRVYLADDDLSRPSALSCDEASWANEDLETFVAAAESLSIRHRAGNMLSLRDLDTPERDALHELLVRQATPPKMADLGSHAFGQPACLRIAMAGLHMMWSESTRASVLACWRGTVAGLRHPYASRTGRAAAALAASIFGHGQSSSSPVTPRDGFKETSPDHAPSTAGRVRAYSRTAVTESKGDDLLSLLNAGLLGTASGSPGSPTLLPTNGGPPQGAPSPASPTPKLDPIFLVVDVSRTQLYIQSPSTGGGRLLLVANKARWLGRHGPLSEGGLLTSYSLDLQRVRSWVARADVNPGESFQWAPEDGGPASATMRNISEEGISVGLDVRKYTPPEADESEQTEIEFRSPGVAVAVEGYEFAALVGAAITLSSRVSVAFKRSPVAAPPLHEALRVAALARGGGVATRAAACALVVDARITAEARDALRSLRASGVAGAASLLTARSKDDSWWMADAGAEQLMLPLSRELERRRRAHDPALCSVLDLADAARKERIARRGSDNASGARPAAVFVEASLDELRFEIVESGPVSRSAPFASALLRGASLVMARQVDGSAAVTAEVREFWVDARGEKVAGGGGGPGPSTWRVADALEAPSSGWGRGDVMVRVHAEQGRAVRGAINLEHLETQVYPMSVRLTEGLIDKVDRFLAPMWATSGVIEHETAATPQGAAAASKPPRGRHRRQRSEQVLGSAFSPAIVKAKHRRQTSDKVPTVAVEAPSAVAGDGEAAEVALSQPGVSLKREVSHGHSQSLDSFSLRGLAAGIDTEAVAARARRESEAATADAATVETASGKLVAGYIRLNQVRLVVDYAGSPFSFTAAQFQLPPRVFHAYHGDWRDLLERVRRDIVWSTLKAAAAITGRKIYETFVGGHHEQHGRAPTTHVLRTPPEPSLRRDSDEQDSGGKKESRGARLFRNLLSPMKRNRKRGSSAVVPTLGD